MLEYLSGIQLRGLKAFVPIIPDWWWKEGVRRRTTSLHDRVARRKLYQEARHWQQEHYYAIRNGILYLHHIYTREDEPTEYEHKKIELPEEVIGLRDWKERQGPVALLADGEQYPLSVMTKRQLIPLKDEKKHRLREFELH